MTKAIFPLAVIKDAPSPSRAATTCWLGLIPDVFGRDE